MLTIQPVNFKKQNNQKITFSALPRKNGMHGDIEHNKDMFYAFTYLLRKSLVRISNNNEDILISKSSFKLDKINKIANTVKIKLAQQVAGLSKYKTEDKLGQCIHDAYEISLMSPKAVKIAPVVDIKPPSNADEEIFADKTRILKVPFKIDADGKDYIVPMDLLSKEMRKIIVNGMDECNSMYVTHNFELGEDMYTVRILNFKDNTSGLRIVKGIGDWSTRAEALKEVL